MFLRRRSWEHQRKINEESNKRVELHIDFLCLQSISHLQFCTLLCSTIIHCRRRRRPRSLNLSSPTQSYSRRLPHPSPHPNPNPYFHIFLYFHSPHSPSPSLPNTQTHPPPWRWHWLLHPLPSYYLLNMIYFSYIFFIVALAMLYTHIFTFTLVSFSTYVQNTL